MLDIYVGNMFSDSPNLYSPLRTKELNNTPPPKMFCKLWPWWGLGSDLLYIWWCLGPVNQNVPHKWTLQGRFFNEKLLVLSLSWSLGVLYRFLKVRNDMFSHNPSITYSIDDILWITGLYKPSMSYKWAFPSIILE